MAAIVIINKVLWFRMQKFTILRHQVHYYVLCIGLLCFVPRYERPAMSNTKYGYTSLNIFIFIIMVASTFGISQLHQYLVLFTAIIY